MADSAFVIVEVISDRQPWATVFAKTPDGSTQGELKPMREGDRYIVPRAEALKLSKRDAVSGMRHVVIVGDAN